MAHCSRLAGFIIDCKTDDLPAAAEFWGAALGLPVTDPNEGDENKYAVLDNKPTGLHIEVQRVAHESRVHLDIESDDIEAEVKRLKALGATEAGRPPHARWVVMQAPTGQRFCVIQMRDTGRGPAVNCWPD